MLGSNTQFDAWFTNREVEIEAWRALLNTPAGHLAPSQSYRGVTGAGKTHLRRRFEQLATAAGVPFITVELDPERSGAFDKAVLTHRFAVALGIETPRTALALLRIASTRNLNLALQLLEERRNQQ